MKVSLKTLVLSLAIIILPVISFAQVQTTATGIAMDCPPTQASATFGIPDFVSFEFYACDSTGSNCGTVPEFISPNGGLPVNDARFIHLPNTNPATCVVQFTTIPYPIGKVYVVKARFGNSVGTSGPSNPSAPFQTLQKAPAVPTNVRTYP